MGAFRMPFTPAGFAILFASLLTGTSPCPSRSDSEAREALALTYQAFDQQLGGGWRKLAEMGDFLAAAKLIDRYEKEKYGLAQWQRVTLRFHAGQLYAFAGKKKLALARLEAAIFAKEPADWPIKWNAYVHATIAFLERD